MSYADQVFRANCLDILQNGVRDDDLTVRPHWADGTVQTGIYQRTFAGSGVDLLTPDDPADQAAVMDIIYNGVKASDLTHDATAFRAACEHLLARGAEVLILGCTELPPAFDIYRLDYPNVDPTLELALAAIRAAGCETK